MLINWIDRHNSADRPHLLTAAGMGVNMTAARAVKKQTHRIIIGVCCGGAWCISLDGGDGNNVVTGVVEYNTRMAEYWSV